LHTQIINKFTTMEVRFENNLDYNKNSGNSRRGSYIFGTILIIIGAALILKNMDILPYNIRNIIFSWQMLLIVIGFIITLDKEKLGGIILMAVGAFFLMPKIFYGIFNVNIFWPAIFIIIGLIFIFSKRSNARVNVRGHSETKVGDNFIDIVNIFSGSDKKILSENFKGGKITTIFGGSEIDLRQAKLAQGVSELEIVCVFGGTTIIVPNDWNVKVEVTSALGGFDEQEIATGNYIDMSKLLVVKGVVVFGGGEVKGKEPK